jgi:GT2 family glycosyltransferase
MIELEYPEVILIRNTVNSGFSAANNLAIKLAKGRFVLLLNPDTIVEEDTFSGCISFMDNHPGAGAMGVRMINGEGRFLPESKRALPSVESAFYKISGLSAVFPKSRIFNKYYLSDIDIYETSETEVISGAFMLILREVFSKTGLLDELFFMYGEDIDLSNRIIQAGYKNYYFPEVKITHFKGKSTSRENYTDIIHFYRAMRIYVRKNYISRSGFLRNLIISAIYMREAVALLIRFIRKSKFFN